MTNDLISNTAEGNDSIPKKGTTNKYINSSGEVVIPSNPNNPSFSKGGSETSVVLDDKGNYVNQSPTIVPPANKTFDDIKSNNVGNEPGFWKQLENEGKQSIAYVTGDLYKLVNRLIYPIVEDIARPRTFTDKEARENPLTKDAVLSDDDRRKMGYSEKDIKDFKKQDEAIHKTQMDFDKNAREGNNIVKAFFPDTKNRFINDVDLMATYLSGHDSKIGGIKSNIEQDLPVPNQWIAKPAGIFKGVAGMAAQGIVIAAALKTSGALAARLLYGIEFPEAASLAESLGNSSLGVPFAMSYGMSGYSADETFDKVRESKIKYYTNRGYDNKRAIFLAEQDATKAANLNMRIETLGNGLLFAVPIGALLQKTKAFGLPEDLIKSLEGKGEVKGLQELEETYSKLNRELLENNGEGWLKKTSKILGRAGQDAWMFGAMHPVSIGSEIAGEHIYGTRKYGDYTTKDNTFDILKLYQEEKDNVLSGFGMGVVMSLFGHVPFLYKESIFDEVKNDKGETIGYTPKAKVDNKGKVVTDYLGNTIFDTKRRIVSKEKLLKLERNRINTIAIEGAKQDVITLKDAYNRYIKNIVDIDNSGSEKDKKAHEEVERAKEDMQNAQMQFSIRNGLDKYLSDGLEAYTKQHKEDKELQQILSDKIKDIKDKRDIWDKLVNDYNWTYEERMTNVLDVLYNIKLNRFSAEKRLTEIKDNINKLDNKINDTTSTIDTESYKSLIDLQDKLIAAQILVKNYDEEFTGYIYDGRILADKDKIAKAESKAQVDYTNAMNGIISRVGEKYTEQYLTKVDDNDKEIKSLSGKDDDVSKSRIKELKEINERLNKEYDEKVDKEVNSILKAAETHYSLDNRREKQYLLNKQLFNESLVDSYNTAFNKITSNKGRIDFMKDFYKSIKILERQERTAKRDDFKRMINSINDLPTLLEVKDKYDKLDDKEFSKLIENRIDEIRTNIKNNLLKSTDVQTVSTVQTPDSEIIIQPEQTGEATEAERIATEKQDNKQANLVAPIVLNKSDKARDIQSSLNVEGHNTGSQYNTNNSGSQKLSKNASSIYKALNELHNKNTNFSLNWDYLTDRIKNVADEETAKLFKAVKNIGDLKELLKDNKARNLFIDRLSIQIDNKNHPPYLARYSYYKFNDTDKGGTDIGEYALTDGLINKYIANLPIKEIIEDIKSLTKTYTNNNRALEGTKDIEDSKTKATILKILNKIFNDKFEDKDLLSNTADRLKVDVYSYNNMLEHLYKLLTFSLGTNGKTVDQLTKEDITPSLDGWLNTLDNDFKGTQAVIQDFIEQINNGNDTDPISKLTKKTRTTVTAMGNLITTDKPHPIKDIFPKYESNGRWVIKNVEDSKTGKSSKKIVFESDFNAKHQWVTINHKMPPINEAEYKIIWDNIDKALTKIKEGKKDIRKEVNAIEQLIWYSFPDNTTDRKKINFTINSNAKPNTGIHAGDIDVLEFEHYIDITKSEYVKVILDSKNKEYSIIVDDKPFAKATTNDELEKILKPLLENKQRNINKNRYEYSDKEGKYMPVSKETTKVKDENGKDTDETELNKEGNELIKSGRIQCYNGKLVSNDNEYLGNNVIRGTQPATITSSSDIEKEGDNIEKEKSLSLFPPKGESSKSQDLPTSEDKIANNKSIVNTELSNVIDKSIEADRYGLLTNYLDKLVNKDYNSKEEVTSNLDLLNDTLINLLKKKIPEGYREVAPNEIIPAGDYDTHMDLTSERTITNAPRTSKSKPIVKDKNEYIINNLNAAIAVLESELDEFKEVEPIVTPTRVETMPRANIITEPDKYQWKSFAHSDINDEDKLKGVVDNESVQKKIAQIRNGERPPIQLEVDESGKLIKNNNETYTTVIGHHTLAAYDKLIETGEYKEEIPYNTSTRRSGESDKVYAERVDRIKGTEYKGIGDDNILFQKVTPTLLDESLAIKYEEGFDNNNQLSFDNSNDAENKLKELNNKYKYQKFELGNDNVKYMFKAVNAMYKEGFPKYDISKNKGEAFFNALKNSGVKKEQIDLVREVVKGYNNLTGKEVAELLDKDFKKDIVIKRGLSDDKTIPQSISNFNIDGDRYYIQDLTFDEATNNIDEAALAYITRGRTDEEIDELYRVKYYKNGQEINKEDYENIYNSLPDNIVTSSKVYQYLSAKGGTNYQEWDIRVPGVEPSIKSHANFANKNSIGWFRADEKSNGFIKDDGNKIETGTHEYYSKNGKYYIREKGSDFIEKEVSSDVYNHAVEIARDYYKTETKDLRVQEVQSDLFQKSRGRDSLVYIKRPKGKNDSHWSYEVDILDYQHEVDIHDHPYIDESEEEYQTRLDNWEQGKPNNANRFLQLLNKDNNWVTFFIKSIMQKAANKGYENIMFPMGETAARIQRHQIIADEIIALDIILDKWKSAKIEKIDKGIDDDFPTSLQATYRVITKNGEILSEYNDIESAQKKIDYRIENLEKQKSDLKTQGIEKLAPTEAYYGKTIKNILTKLYGDRLTEFTDEYGNSWNKISLKNIDKESILFSKVNNSIEHKGLKEGVTVDYKGNPILPAYKDAPEAIKGILNMLGEKMGYKFNLLDVADKFKGRFGKEVDINTRYASYDTPFHEYLHPLVRALKTKNTPAYLNLINEINDTLINNSGLLSNILSDKDYSTDGKSLTDAGYEEAIVEVSGRKAVDILQDRNVKQSLKEAILAFWNEIKETIKSIVPNRVGLDYFGPKTTISDLAKFMLDPNIELDRNEYDSVKPFVGYSQVKQEDKFATGFNGIEEKAAIELINHTIDQLTQGDTKKDKDKRSKYSLKDRVTNQFRNWSQPNNVNVGNIYPRTDAQQAFHAKVVDAITAHDIKDESTTKNSIWTKAQIALNRDYKINIDDDEKETNKRETEGKGFQEDNHIININNSVNIRVKNFLRNLPLTNMKGEYEINDITGLPKFTNYSDIFNTLSDGANGILRSSTVQDMFYKLNKLSSSNPTVKEIIKRLNGDNKDLVAAFFTSFSQSLRDELGIHFTKIFSNDGSYKIIAKVQHSYKDISHQLVDSWYEQLGQKMNTLEEKVRKDLESGLTTKGKYDPIKKSNIGEGLLHNLEGGLTTKDTAGTTKYNEDITSDKLDKVINIVSKQYKEFGIRITPDEISNFMNTQEAPVEAFYKIFVVPLRFIAGYLGSKLDKEGKVGKDRTIGDRVNKLAEAVYPFRMVSYQASYLDFKGKLKYPISPPSSLTNEFDKFNNSNPEIQKAVRAKLILYKHIPGISFCNWFSKDIEKTIKDFTKLRIYPVEGMKFGIDSKDNSEMTNSDRYLYDLYSYLIPIDNSHISRTPLVTQGDSGQRYGLAAPIIYTSERDYLNGKLKQNSPLYNGIMNTVRQELARMLQAKHQMFEQQEDGKYKLKDDLTGLVKNYHYIEDKKTKNPTYIDKDDNAIGRVFKFHNIPELNNLSKDLFSQGMIVDGIDFLIDDSKRDRKNESQNKTVKEITDIVDKFIDNIINTELPKYAPFEKMSEGIWTDSKNPIAGGVWKQVITEFGVNSYINNVETGNLFLGTDAEYATSEDKAKRAKELLAPRSNFSGLHMGDGYKNITLHDIMGKSNIIDDLEKALRKQGISDRKINEALQTYRDGTTESDGQELVSNDFYIKYLLEKGVNLNGYIEKSKDGVYKFIHMDEYDAPQLGVQKSYTYDRIYNPDLNQIFSTQLKSAIYRLDDYYANEGSLLAEIRKAIEDARIDKVSYNSAVKVGAHGVGSVINSKFTGEITDIPTSATGSQVEIPDHSWKAKIRVSKQIKAMIINHLILTETYNHNGNNISGTELFTRFNNAQYNIIKGESDKLKGELNDPNELAKILNSSSSKFGTNINIQLLFKTNENGELPMGLNWPSITNKVAQDLMALFDNRITNYKINGGQFTIVSNAGRGGKSVKSYYDEKKGIVHEIAISAWGDECYKSDENGKLIFVNGEPVLKLANELTEEQQSMFGYRTPFSDLHSGGVFKVVEILPKSSGGICIIPPHAMTAMGSDNDSDKLYIHIHNTDAKPGSQEADENELVSIWKTIYSHPSTLYAQVKPVLYKESMDAASKVRDIVDPTGIESYSTLNEQHRFTDKHSSGKELISHIAGEIPTIDALSFIGGELSEGVTQKYSLKDLEDRRGLKLEDLEKRGIITKDDKNPDIVYINHKKVSTAELGQLLDAMTDISKLEDIPVNYNKFTDSIVHSSVLLNGDYDYAWNLIAQNSIRDITKVHTDNSLLTSSEVDKKFAVAYIRNKYAKLLYQTQKEIDPTSFDPTLFKDYDVVKIDENIANKNYTYNIFNKSNIKLIGKYYDKDSPEYYTVPEMNTILKNGTKIDELSPEQKVIYYAQQLNLINRYEELTKVGKDLLSASQKLNSYKAGAGDNVSFNRDYIDNILKTNGNIIINGKPFEYAVFPNLFGFNKESVYPNLEHYVKYVNQAAIDILAKHFTIESNQVHFLINKIYNDLNIFNQSAKDRLYRKFINMLINHLLEEHDWFKPNREETIKNLGVGKIEINKPSKNISFDTFKDLSFGEKIEAQKIRLDLNPLSKHVLNYLDTKLSPYDIDKNEFHYVDFKNTHNEIDLDNDLINSFQAMNHRGSVNMSIDEEFENELFDSAVKYAKDTFGFAYGNNSFAKLVPIEALINAEVGDVLNNANKDIHNGTISLPKELTDIFIRGNINNIPEARAMFHNNELDWGTPRWDSNPNTPMIFYNIDKFTKHIDNSIKNSMYIKVRNDKTKSYTIFKRYHTNRDIKYMIFYPVETKGKWNVQEITNEPTMFDSNKVGATEQQFKDQINESYFTIEDYSRDERFLDKYLEKKMLRSIASGKLNRTEENIENPPLEENKDNIKLLNEKIKGDNISSNSKGFAASLTNPTVLAKSKGHLSEDYPIEYNGKKYKDVEAAYQANKTEYLKNKTTNKLMSDLIEIKLKTYPELVKGITERGGIEYLEKCTHIVKGDNFWESGEGKSNSFIKSLIDAYKKVSNIPKESTPDNITSLKPNEIFVFGSNAEGNHGKGAALIAKDKFGAIQGQAEGLQGQSYAIITKKDWKVSKSSSLDEIKEGINKMLTFAKNTPDKKFLVTKLGSNLAGYKVDEIKNIFSELKDNIPSNVVLPKEYEVRYIPSKVRDFSRLSDVKESNSNEVNVLRKYNTDEHYGNPFTGTDKGTGTIQMKNINDAVTAYKEWLKNPDATFTDKNGKEWTNVKPEQRKWILEQINSGKLDGKTLLYYKTEKYYSHADALRDYINEIRGLKEPKSKIEQTSLDFTEPKESPTIKLANRDIKVDDLKDFITHFDKDNDDELGDYYNSDIAQVIITAYDKNEDRWNKEHPNQKFPYNNEKEYVEDALKSYSDFEVFQNEIFKSELKLLDVPDINVKPSGEQFRFEQRANMLPEDSADRFSKKMKYLNSIWAKHGVNVPFIEDRNISGHAEVEGKNGKFVVKYNPTDIRRDSAFHEYGHVLLHLLGGLDNEFIRTGVEQLRGTKLWNDISAIYADKDDDARQLEILNTAIGIDANELFEEKGKVGKFRFWVNRLFDRFADLLHKVTGGMFGKEQTVARELALDLLKGRLRSTRNGKLVDFFAEHKKNIDEIDDDSDKYKNAIERGTEEDGLYINTKTGKRYERVSKVLEEYQDKFDISLAKNEVGKPYAKELKLNTTEDVVKFWDYLRDGVGTGIHNKIHSYIKNGTKSDLPIQLTDWIDNLKKTGKLYSELRIVEDNHGKGSVDGMGGSLDLLHINKSGKHTIYDFKTKREGKFNWFNYEGDKSEFKGELNSFLKGIKQSTSNEYAVRLATYNYILNENLVNPVEAELKIIPITVDITRNDKGEFQYNNVQFGATVGLGDKEEFKTEIKLPNYVNNMHDFFLRGDNVKDAIKVKKDAIDRKAITTADVIKHTNSVKALSELHENIVKNTKRKSNLSNTLKEVTANTSELVFFLKHPESFDIASYEEVELMKSFGKTYEAIGKSIDDTLTNIGDMLENYRGFKLQNLSKAEYNDMFKTIYEAKTLANIYEAIDNIDDLPGEDTEALTDVQKEIVSLIKSINSKKEDIKILNRKVDLLENKTFADAFATNLTNPIFEGKDLDELVEFLNDFRHVDESSIQGWANSINNSNEPFLTYVGQRYRDMKLNTDTKIREVRTIIVNKFQDYLKSKGAFEKLLDKEHWKNFTKVISKDIFTRGDVRRHWKELTKFIDKDRMFIREHDYNKYNEAKEKEIGEIKDRFSKEYDKSYKEGDLSLSDMEDKEGWVSRMSKFEIAKWYEDNTKNVDYKIEKARTIYQSEHLTTEAFDKWKAENFIKGGKYYTVGGEFSTPSDRFKNPEFDKFDDKDKEMLKFMIDTVNEYSEGHQKKGLIPSYRTTRLKVKGKDGKDDDKIGRDINGDVAYNLNMEGLGFMNTVPRIYIPKYGEGINPKTKEYNIGESNEEYEIRALEEINNYGHSFKSLKEVELENRKIDKENKEHMSDGLENNLINILLDFTAGGIKYNAKADLEDELKLVGAMIRSKTFENSKKEDITGDASKANKHFENFMKMVFYEDFYSEAAKSKWVKYLQGLTTNLGLLFNYLGQAKYMILAPIRKFELTQSKEIGNRKDSYKAYWFYMKGLKSYFTDPINMSGKSTTIQQALIKKSGVMLTSIDKAVAYKTGIFAKLGKAIGWHMVNKAGFAVLHSTVHFNQVNVLFEMMYSHRIVEHKIIDKSGNKVTYKVEALIDYLEDRLPKEGTIIDPKEYKKLKEKYTKEFEQNPNLISSFELRNGEAELKKGVKLDDKALSAFFNKVRAINGTFHGIYNVEDKGAFEGTLGGMLSMIFHRWIKPGYDRRFGATGKAWDLNKKGYYDEALQTMNKGDRTAFFKGMMNVLTVPFSEESKNKFGGEERDVLGTINAIVKGYGDYVNHATLHWANTSLRDRASIIRSVTAFAGMAIIWSLSAELYRLMKDSKYKHNYALNTCLYLLNSLKDIEMAYVPIYGLLVDSNPMGASGFASVRTIKLIYTLGADALHCYRHDKKEYFQSGKHKHQRKFGVHLMNAIPISNNINRDISNYIDTYKLHPYFWEQDK